MPSSCRPTGGERTSSTAVGGQGIEWNYPLVQYIYQYGYPARAPFNGDDAAVLHRLDPYNDGGHVGINCNMTEGASGGPWLDDFDGTFGRSGQVSTVGCSGTEAGVRYKWNGPYFGDGARNLHNRRAGCAARSGPRG